MGLGDFLDKAKDMAHGHEEQVDDAIEKGEDLAKGHLPDQADSAIEGAGNRARDYLGSDGTPA